MSVEVYAELAQAGVATVYEAYGRCGLLDVDLIAVCPGRSAAGPARIASCGQDDNRAVHEVMAHLQPGEILVLTMPQAAAIALFGDLLATQAQKAGAAGVLVDAAVRDTAELSALAMPTWARWRRATGATKTVRGEIDVPVRIGGAVVEPGDVIVLDDDGATVIARADLDGAVDAVRARIAKEDDLRRRWASGELSYDAYGLRAEDEKSSV